MSESDSESSEFRDIKPFSGPGLLFHPNEGEGTSDSNDSDSESSGLVLPDVKPFSGPGLYPLNEGEGKKINPNQAKEFAEKISNITGETDNVTINISDHIEELDNIRVVSFPIKATTVQHWKCLNSHVPRDKTTSCNIDSATLLGIIPRELGEFFASCSETCELSQLMGLPTHRINDKDQLVENVGTSNTLLPLIVSYIISGTSRFTTTLASFAFTSPQYAYIIFKYIVDKLNSMHKITHEITQGIPLMFGRDDIGHTVVLICNTSDPPIPMILDPQQQIFYLTELEIINYISDQKFTSVCILNAIPDKRTRTGAKIRDITRDLLSYKKDIPIELRKRNPLDEGSISKKQKQKHTSIFDEPFVIGETKPFVIGKTYPTKKITRRERGGENHKTKKYKREKTHKFKKITQRVRRKRIRKNHKTKKYKKKNNKSKKYN